MKWNYKYRLAALYGMATSMRESDRREFLFCFFFCGDGDGVRVRCVNKPRLN